jgi:hypothetical protein
VTWQSAEDWRGRFEASPHAVSWGSGRLDVFARGTDQTLQHWWFDDGPWGGPESLGGRFTDSPAAVSWGSGRLDVFARGTNETLQHWWWFDDGPWGGPESLGGRFTDSPAAVAWAAGRLDVFARGDTGIWPITSSDRTRFIGGIAVPAGLQHWRFDSWRNDPWTRPSKVFHDSGDNAKGFWSARAIVARDVTVAGWLVGAITDENGIHYELDRSDPVGFEPDGSEDWHYSIYLDPDFIRKYYDNHLGPLRDAFMGGNLREVRLNVPRISLLNGSKPTVDTFLLPGGSDHLTVELNAWHERPTIRPIDTFFLVLRKSDQAADPSRPTGFTILNHLLTRIMHGHSTPAVQATHHLNRETTLLSEVHYGRIARMTLIRMRISNVGMMPIRIMAAGWRFTLLTIYIVPNRHQASVRMPRWSQCAHALARLSITMFGSRREDSTPPASLTLCGLNQLWIVASPGHRASSRVPILSKQEGSRPTPWSPATAVCMFESR